MKLSRIVALFTTALLLLLVDFLTKAACYYLLPIGSLGSEGIVVFKNFLGISAAINLAFNHGAAWGLFSSLQVPLLIFRILVIMGMLAYLFFKEHRKAIDWPMMFICVGAIGNVIDFFIYGFVIDFVQLNLWGYHFPLFNVADSLITVGVFWLFAISSKKKKSLHECDQVDQTSRSSL